MWINFSGDCQRATTPTATETMLPWKREDDYDSTRPVKQNEFPAWCSNKEYLAYNSPSATFLGEIQTGQVDSVHYQSLIDTDTIVGGIEQPKIQSVIGLFGQESICSINSTASQDEIDSTPSVPQLEYCYSPLRLTGIYASRVDSFAIIDSHLRLD